MVVVAVLGLMAVTEVGSISTEVRGVVVPAIAKQSRHPESGRVWVELDSGELVRASVPGNLSVQPGRAVVLSRTETLFFGWPRFRLLRYE